ncbi:MAG TPA: HPF/RaiA family ribosome-associated protein [Minicystis sp.]|nr:HPF/RaiA family ribosome-associated protein [Minicystis sp.]
MQTPLQITFRGIGPSDAIEDYVRARADKLEHFFDRITGCHVMIETPHRHKRHGYHHRIRIDLVVPGKELVVTRDPDERKGQEDVYASIDAAFDDAQRVLEDQIRTQRGDVKPRETPSRHGRVVRLDAHAGFGFLTTREGEELYFHRNSVLNHAFDRLEIGTRVRFVEESGDEGPQASTVAIVG